VGRPLWREDGSVIYSYNCLWVLPEQWLSGPNPAELTALFYCLIWDFPNLEGQVPVFMSPRNRVAQLFPWALGSLYVVFYDTRGYGGGILTRLHKGPYLYNLVNYILKLIVIRIETEIEIISCKL
jgi:hypothetical protein